MRPSSNPAINKTNTLRIRRVHTAYTIEHRAHSTRVFLRVSHMNKLARTYRIDYARLRTAASLLLWLYLHMY